MRWLRALIGRRGPVSTRPVLPRLEWYLGELGRYRVWVCLGDVWSPWMEVRTWQEGILTTQGPRVPVRAVRAYVVSYPGGTIVDQEPPTPRRLPLGVHYLPDLPRVSHLLTRRDFLRGAEWVSVAFSPCVPRPQDSRYRTATLRNQGLDSVRVIRFGSYRADGMLYRLDTLTGGFFTDSDFREWYGVPDGWIEARADVADLTAYTGGASLWAYELETQAGDRFWTAGSVNAEPPPG